MFGRSAARRAAGSASTAASASRREGMGGLLANGRRQPAGCWGGPEVGGTSRLMPAVRRSLPERLLLLVPVEHGLELVAGDAGGGTRLHVRDRLLLQLVGGQVEEPAVLVELPPLVLRVPDLG